jgi:hypothetical protein
MNETPKEYKILEPTFTKNGFLFQQVQREGDIAIYHKVAQRGPLHVHTADAGFEVVVISRHNGYVLGGATIEPAETLPSSEQWGTKGWSYKFLHPAQLKFSELKKKSLKATVVDGVEIEEQDENSIDSQESTSQPKQPVVSSPSGKRGRPRIERPMLTYPEGEFSTKEMAELNKVEHHVIANFLRDQELLNKVKRTRTERRAAKGKPTQLYSAV